jgi:hypothetical protein
MSSSLNYSVYQSSESVGTKKRVATLGKPVSDSIMTTTTIEEDDKSKSGEKKTKTASEKKSKPPQMGGNMMRERERPLRHKINIVIFQYRIRRFSPTTR